MKYRVVEDAIGLPAPRYWLESSTDGEGYWSRVECLDSLETAKARMAAHIGYPRVVASSDEFLVPNDPAAAQRNSEALQRAVSAS